MRGTPPALQIAAENFQKVVSCQKMNIVHHAISLIANL